MTHRDTPLFIAIGGGKGGTGKSLISVQFGVLLAQMGVRVILIDADPNGANLHSFFGLEDPDHSLDEALSRPNASVEAALPTGLSHLHLLPGLRDGLTSPVTVDVLRTLVATWRDLQTDVILCDVGSGLQDWSTFLFAQADVGIVVTMPEAIAIEKEYRFLRSVCRWPIREAQKIPQHPPANWLPAPWLARLQQTEPELAEQLRKALQRQSIGLIVNAVRIPEEKELAQEIVAVSQRFLGIRARTLGWLEYDERLWLSILNRQPMVRAFPESRWTYQIQEMLPNLLHLIQQDAY